ncbi:MAG: transcriptional regulator FtsR, partial [Pseudonocardiaceae bacterium]
MTVAAGRSPYGPEASIGSVLAQLRADFPDVTISKIRFLESEGLVQPQRTAAGYRQFSPADIERLRYVLAAQRDHYLPLKVIKEHLDAMDRGEHGGPVDGAGPRLPRPLVGVANRRTGATGPATPEDFVVANT